MKPTVALCMIVRDESAVIGRCLESVRGLIDTWVICDTGSRDRTAELIEAELKEIPGRLLHDQWRDFGFNRSRLMEAARGAADYLLLLDADMTVAQVEPLPELSADAYLLSHAGELGYRVPRLVRGDREWRFVGSTHEYLDARDEIQTQPLDALVVYHYGDGGSRREKFVRDLELLERDLAGDPANPRTVFYLAQTVSDLGDTDRAIELYERRVAMAGWEEERFYAALRAGQLRAGRNEDGALPALIEAWELRPQRAEPLYELARLCRLRGWRALGQMFAAHGAMLGEPEDILFVHRWVYRWGMRFELAYALFWVGQADTALVLVEALLQEGDLPADAESGAHELRQACLDQLPAEHRRVFRAPALDALAQSFTVGQVELKIEPAWPQFNPSIAADGDGFRMIVRSANYRLTDGRYEFLDGERTIRTLNYLVELDGDLTVRDVRGLRDLTDGPRIHPSRVEGYEDCRLFCWQGRWLATATVRDRNPVERCQQALLELNDDTITRVSLLDAPIAAEHEKNWMPFVRDGSVCFVYRAAAPTIVLGCEPDGWSCHELARHPAPGVSELRGGSTGLPVPGGHLFVVHEPGYHHRFALLGPDDRLAALSPRFTFTESEVEYCAGLARRRNQLLLSFGVEDRVAMLGLVDADEVLSLLEPL